MMQATKREQFIVVKLMASAFSAYGIYPPGHPSLKALLNNFHQRLSGYLSGSGPLILDIRRDTFYIGKEALEQQETVQKLAIELLGQKIIKIAFFPGVRLGELEKVFAMLSRGEGKKGALAKNLAKAGVTRIKIEQLEKMAAGAVPNAGSEQASAAAKPTPGAAPSRPQEEAAMTNPIAADILDNSSLTVETKAKRFSSAVSELGDFFENMDNDEAREEWFTSLFKGVNGTAPELQRELAQAVPSDGKWIFRRISEELGKAVKEAQASPILDAEEERLPSAFGNLADTAPEENSVPADEIDLNVPPEAMAAYQEVDISPAAVGQAVTQTVLEMLPTADSPSLVEKSMAVLAETTRSLTDPAAMCEMIVDLGDAIRSSAIADESRASIEEIFKNIVESDSINLIIKAGGDHQLRSKGARALVVVGERALPPIVERIIKSSSERFRSNTLALLKETGWDYVSAIAKNLFAKNSAWAVSAAELLGMIGTTESLNHLKGALDHTSGQLIKPILAAIASHQDHAAAELILRIMREASERSGPAARALAQRTDPESTSMLKKFVLSRVIRRKSLPVKKAAVQAMSESKRPEFQECLETLVQENRTLWHGRWEELKKIAMKSQLKSKAKSVLGARDDR